MTNHDLANELRNLRTLAPASLLPAVLAETGLADRYVEHDSPLGPLFVVFTPDGVASVDLATSAGKFEAGHEARTGRPLLRVDEAPENIARHLDRAIAEGRPGRLPVDLSSLTEFQASVLEMTARIPRGEVRPYGWVAKEIGNRGAVRAVGTALASNPVPVIIPCHRVVRSDGSLGRYSLGDRSNKRALLEAEGMDTEEFERLAARGVRYTGSDTTRIFCHPTCRHARRTTDAHHVEFRSETEARRDGYRPCKVCRPVAAA